MTHLKFYFCDKCNFASTLRGQWKRHLKKHHAIEKETFAAIEPNEGNSEMAIERRASTNVGNITHAHLLSSFRKIISQRPRFRVRKMIQKPGRTDSLKPNLFHLSGSAEKGELIK